LFPFFIALLAAKGPSMPKKGTAKSKKRWTNSSARMTGTSPAVPAPLKALAYASAHAQELERRAAREEEEEALAVVQLSRAAARDQEEANEELERALQISLAFSEEEKELRNAIEVSEELQRAVEMTKGLTDVDSECDALAQPAHPTASPTTNSQALTLKIYLGRDTRRARAAWPLGASPAVVLEEVHRTIRSAFGSALQGGDFALKYFDGDGDACTLVKATLVDALSFASGGVLRLWVHAAEGVDGRSSAGGFQLITSAKAKADVMEVSIATPPPTPRDSSGSCGTSDDAENLDWTVVG
jgi:hypothetical protein